MESSCLATNARHCLISRNWMNYCTLKFCVIVMTDRVLKLNGNWTEINRQNQPWIFIWPYWYQINMINNAIVHICYSVNYIVNEHRNGCFYCLVITDIHLSIITPRKSLSELWKLSSNRKHNFVYYEKHHTSPSDTIPNSSPTRRWMGLAASIHLWSSIQTGATPWQLGSNWRNKRRRPPEFIKATRIAVCWNWDWDQPRVLWNKIQGGVIITLIHYNDNWVPTDAADGGVF